MKFPTVGGNPQMLLEEGELLGVWIPFGGLIDVVLLWIPQMFFSFFWMKGRDLLGDSLLCNVVVG